MAKRTKKVGICGKYGTRYGATLKRSSRSSRSVSTPLTSLHSAVRTVSRESPEESGNAKEPIRKSLVVPMPSRPCQPSLPRPLSCVLRESETRPRPRIEREQILQAQLASFHMHFLSIDSNKNKRMNEPTPMGPLTTSLEACMAFLLDRPSHRVCSRSIHH